MVSFAVFGEFAELPASPEGCWLRGIDLKGFSEDGLKIDHEFGFYFADLESAGDVEGFFSHFDSVEPDRDIFFADAGG